MAPLAETVVRALLDGLAEGVLAVAPDGRIRLVNGAMAQLLGTPGPGCWTAGRPIWRTGTRGCRRCCAAAWRPGSGRRWSWSGRGAGWR